MCRILSFCYSLPKNSLFENPKIQCVGIRTRISKVYGCAWNFQNILSRGFSSIIEWSFQFFYCLLSKITRSDLLNFFLSLFLFFCKDIFENTGIRIEKIRHFKLKLPDPGIFATLFSTQPLLSGCYQSIFLEFKSYGLHLKTLP